MAQRTPLVAGNWKMNPPTAGECRSLLESLRQRIDGVPGVTKVVCPPFVWLSYAQQELEGADIAIGAQNVHWETQGPFAGEVSANMLRAICGYVIIGHSERRQHFGETDDMINRKVTAALATRLMPILCVGETRSEREEGRTEEILIRQLFNGLKGVSMPSGFIIAYEPVWAIGSGEAATAETANEAIAVIRQEVASQCGPEAAARARILYGGSVNPSNIADFVGQPEIDGALVGGASLDADAFSAIVHTTARVKGA